MYQPNTFKKGRLWLAAILLPLGAAADTFTWQPTASGTYEWAASANWNPSTGFPNAVGDIANMNVNLAGTQTVEIGLPVTLGKLTLGDSSSTFYSTTLNPVETGSLTLQATGTDSAFLSRTTPGSSDAVNLDLQLASPLTIEMTASGTWGGMRLNGTVSGGNGIHVLATTAPTGSNNQFVELSNINNSYTGDTTVSNGALVFKGNVFPGQNSALGNSMNAVKIGSPDTQVHATTNAQYSAVTQLRLQALDDDSDYEFARDIDFSGNNGAASNLNGRARFALDGDGTGSENTNTVTLSGQITLPSASRTAEFLPTRAGQTIYITGDILSSPTGSAGNIIWAPGSPNAGSSDGKPNGTIRFSDRARPYTNSNSLTYGTFVIEGTVPASGPSPIGTQSVSLSDGSGGNVFSANSERANRRVFLSTPGTSYERSISPSSGTSYNLATANTTIQGRYGNGESMRAMNGYHFGGLNTSGTVTFSGNISPVSVFVPVSGTAAGAGGTNEFKVVHNIALTAADGGTTAFTGIISGNSIPQPGSTAVPANAVAYNNTRITINQFLNHPNLDTGIDGLPDADADMAYEAAVQGTVIFTSANTYAGGTIVLGGTLLVNNVAGSGTGAGDVVVRAGRLGGTGIIDTLADVKVEAGGTISPGDPAANNGVGVFTLFAPVSWAATGGSALEFQVSRTSSDINDSTLSKNLNEDGSLKWDAIASNENNGYTKLATLNNDTLFINGILTVNSSGATVVRIASAPGSEETAYAAGMVWDLLDWVGLENARYNSYVFEIDPALKADLAAKNLAVDVSRFWDTGMVGIAPASIVNPPRFVTTTLPSGLVGDSYNVTLQGAHGSLPYTFAVTEGSLPAGLSLTAEGALTGTLEAEGAASFTLTLTDAAEATVSQNYTVYAVASLPVVNTGTPLPQAFYGTPYTATLTGTGGTGTYTWEVVSGSLPPGIALNADGTLAGTPTNIGTYGFEVRLSDISGYTATGNLQIVSVAPPLVVTSGPVLLPGILKVAYKHTLTATGGVPGSDGYTWALVDGELPAGLVLSPQGVISGKPTATEETNSQFVVQVTDSLSTTQTQSLSMIVYPAYQKPVVEPVSFNSYTVGELFEYQLSASNYPKSFKVVGLPKGLRLSAATGLITGRPTVAGVYPVVITALNKGNVSDAVEGTIEVAAIDSGMVGTFQGLVSRDASNSDLGGTVSLTTTTLGRYTLRVVTRAGTKSATGYLSPTAPHITANLHNADLALTLDGPNNLLSGTHGGATVEGWRQTWSKTAQATSRVGYYSFALDLANPADQGILSIPQGTGYATFKVATTGTLKVVGKTADGQTVTSAGFVGPNGEIGLHMLLYRKLGSITGKLTLAVPGEGGTLEDNAISGAVTWSKPLDKSRAYTAGFGPLDLVAEGGYLAAKTGGALPSLPLPGTASLLFTDGGLAQASLDPDVAAFTYTEKFTIVMPQAGSAENPASAKLTLNKGTGAVKGTFKLSDDIGLTRPLARTVTFIGQLVKTADGGQKAAGYFLLPQLPEEGQKTTQTPILSGGMSIRQELPDPEPPAPAP